jgi:hypothetical protein
MSELTVSLMHCDVVFWGLIALVDDLSCVPARPNESVQQRSSDRPSLCIGRLSIDTDTSSSDDPFKA